MALNCASLSAGDQRDRVAYRCSHGDLSPSAQALAMVSGDSFLVAGPEAVYPGPRPTVRPSVRTEGRRGPGGGRGAARLLRNRQNRFSPYPTPGVKLDLLRTVLQQRLIAFGSIIAARLAV
ncbi:uncharacterized protein C11orf71 homolog [Dipodomys merriami]|uniref:uncharacterized protein C11orf71 homolog n=1 Tax=Dipodomys spectabilis TaxID=105255 RepID=UPI001C537FBD|nr:uncharacterized protein C11orf71 homolog [Dipodomys spectabilis]